MKLYSSADIWHTFIYLFIRFFNNLSRYTYVDNVQFNFIKISFNIYSAIYPFLLIIYMTFCYLIFRF